MVMQSILSAALKTKGAAGPSNLDADGWRRILVSRNYGNVGEDLRTSLANMLKIMCRQNIDPNTRDIEAFLSCRLIVYNPIYPGAGKINPPSF